MIKIGKRTIKNSGMFIDMARIAAKTLNKDLKTILVLSGILYSTHSISLLNRFRIRPTGVDSKNLMLHLFFLRLFKVYFKMKAFFIRSIRSTHLSTE